MTYQGEPTPTNAQIMQLELLITGIIEKTKQFTNKWTKKERKSKGQFFSSLGIAQYMASEIAVSDLSDIRILDPGAGNGLLGVCAMKHLLAKSKLNHIHITFVENDPEVLNVLLWVLNQLSIISQYGPTRITAEIREENFITSTNCPLFDVLVCNPPYAKLSKKSPESLSLSKYVYGQPNIYSLFAVKGIELLKAGGQFVFITPRSWTSGSYYKPMRSAVLSNTRISHMHIFSSRDAVFSSEDVLQETMIWCGTKGRASGNAELRISTSANDSFAPIASFKTSIGELCSFGDKDNHMLIPTEPEDLDIIREMSSFSSTFESLGYVFRTGPVVEFRNTERVSVEQYEGAVPMFRPSNVKDGEFLFPVLCNKPQYVDIRGCPILAIPNQPTVLVRRLSAKEEKRRLQCCCYDPVSDSDFISIENHVNYMLRKDGYPLQKDEVLWAYKVLSSEKYDKYFRMISGSTQINASELNHLPVQGDK